MSCKATFSSYFASVLQDKTPPNCPQSARCPLGPTPPPLITFPCPDEKAMMFTAHFSWMDFRFLPSFFLVFVLGFFCVSVSGWWGEWSLFRRKRGVGWGFFMMTRLVRCMGVFSVCGAIVDERSCSFHIHRWLLYIIHSCFFSCWAVLQIVDLCCETVIPNCIWLVVTLYYKGLSTCPPSSQVVHVVTFVLSYNLKVWHIKTF